GGFRHPEVHGEPAARLLQGERFDDGEVARARVRVRRIGPWPVRAGGHGEQSCSQGKKRPERHPRTAMRRAWRAATGAAALGWGHTGSSICLREGRVPAPCVRCQARDVEPAAQHGLSVSPALAPRWRRVIGGADVACVQVRGWRHPRWVVAAEAAPTGEGAWEGRGGYSVPVRSTGRARRSWRMALTTSIRPSTAATRNITTASAG